MALPALYTQAGQILAFLDSEEGRCEWTAHQLADRLGMSVAQAVTACSSQFLEGRIGRVTGQGTPRYLGLPHYPVLPALYVPRGTPLVPCVGLRLC